jgi:hypothetical protein
MIVIDYFIKKINNGECQVEKDKMLKEMYFIMNIKEPQSPETFHRIEFTINNQIDRYKNHNKSQKKICITKEIKEVDGINKEFYILKNES